MRQSLPTNPLQRSGTAALIAALVFAAGCSSMSEREQGTAKGAGAGAVAGAIIGSMTGGNARRGRRQPLVQAHGRQARGARPCQPGHRR
jgi:hypothetical protein